MNTSESHWENLFHTSESTAFIAKTDNSSGGVQLTPVSSELPAGIAAVFPDFNPERIKDEHPFFDMFLEEAREFWNAEHREDIMKGPQSGSWVEPHPDGTAEDLYFEAKAFSIRGHHYLLLDDLGDRYLKNQSLLQKGRENLLLNEQLQREVHLREILYHCMIHDMRGPMNNIQLALDIISGDSSLDQKQEKMLQIARKAIAQQGQLIDDLLLAFKEEGLEASGQVLPEVDTLSVARDTIEMLKGQAAAATVTCRLEPPPESEHLTALADAAALGRSLYNLISNAIRHSPENGTITVEIKSLSDGIEMRVCDQGPGITPGDEKKLFEKFNQGTGKKSGKVGLGLYYCRLAMQRMGGSIGAHNRTDTSGACFWLKLPHSIK